MALLQVSVLIGTPVLPDTMENRRKIFVMAGRTTRNPGYGNVPYTVPKTGQYRFNLNNPAIPGAISVSSFAPVRFDSHDLIDQPELAGQIVHYIEGGYIQVEDTAAPGTPLDRADVMAFV
jgi:hypothetical protein